MDGVVVRLHPCPYCQNPAVSIVETEDEDGRRGCVVACGTCGMCGPESRSVSSENAARAWEILCSRMCTHCRTNLIKHFTGRIKELKTEIATINQKLGERQ